LVAFNLHGESLEGASHLGASVQPLAQGSTQRRVQGGAEVGVDSLTGREIQRLAARKEAAVAEENYDEAKALKAGIERLRLVGAKILELETR
jgi:centrosomal protein CEP104